MSSCLRLFFTQYRMINFIFLECLQHSRHSLIHVEIRGDRIRPVLSGFHESLRPARSSHQSGNFSFTSRVPRCISFMRHI